MIIKVYFFAAEASWGVHGLQEATPWHETQDIRVFWASLSGKVLWWGGDPGGALREAQRGQWRLLGAQMVNLMRAVRIDGSLSNCETPINDSVPAIYWRNQTCSRGEVEWWPHSITPKFQLNNWMQFSNHVIFNDTKYWSLLLNTHFQIFTQNITLHNMAQSKKAIIL